MKRQAVSRFFSLLCALALVIGGGWLSVGMQSRQPPPPDYAVLNARASVMTPQEFLVLAAVNVNEADRLELRELPGIGEVLADRIVAYRQEHGAFASVEELIKVKGIGEKTIRLLRETAYAA